MKAETKVGILFLVSLAMVVVFAFSLGTFNPFGNSNQLTLLYSFAGGIEVGSPVRVMGIKVGKVKSIEFDPSHQGEQGDEISLKVHVTISKEAWPTIRKDSKFFINLAGVIGEKFIEVTPGSSSSEQLKPGQSVRGEDPPRIDQLISQSYGLAGKIFEFVEQNESSFVDTIDMMNKLVTNLNETLKLFDKATKDRDTKQLIKNMAIISDDMAFFTQKLRSEEGQKTIRLLNELVHRMEPMDAKAIRKFLQEEGIRAKLF